jgi:hypothetical protein
MKTFPDKLRPCNKYKFVEYKFNRELCKLRQKIVDYMYSEDNGGFDLKSSTENGLFSYNHIDEKLIETIRIELHDLGWKTKLAYGNTTLFIYSDEKDLPLMSDMEPIE